MRSSVWLHAVQRWVSRRAGSEPDSAGQLNAFDRLRVSMSGYAVRRMWADGSHELLLFRRRRSTAERAQVRDMHFWRRGPVQPVAWQVVAVDAVAYQVHGGRCTEPACALAGLVTATGGAR